MECLYFHIPLILWQYNRHTKCWYDSSTRLDAGRLHVHFSLKVLQVYWLRLDSKSWSYLVLFLPWSKIIVWIQPRTGPQLSGKRPQRRKSGWLFGPPAVVDRLCPGTGKTKGEKYRLQRVKGVGKSCWKVARYTSKVTGLGVARALHWKSIHGTKYL